MPPTHCRAGAGALLGILTLVSCVPGEGRDGDPQAGEEHRAASNAAPLSWAGPVGYALPEPGDREPLHETDLDWQIARASVQWALEQDLNLLPVGEVTAILGATFVGAAYRPGTLELPGPESLVVNLAEFDCVTFVEHLLVLSRLVVHGGEGLLDDEDAFRERYRHALADLRYRGGVLERYPSRLHYFSEWIRDAEVKGWARNVTRELGGIRDERPIHFMSSNPHAYRQLGGDPGYLERIRETERRLSGEPRYYIPQDRIAQVASRIRNGDVIAAVSSVDGLDIAHTGFALWQGGRLHLLHAPLVGESVEISARPLADRIQNIPGQKGIMVARPLDPRNREGVSASTLRGPEPGPDAYPGGPRAFPETPGEGR